MSQIFTLSTITSEIAASLKKELDEPFKRMLGDKVDAWRSTLLRRTLKENPKERVHFRQTIFVQFEKTVPVPECLHPGAPVCSVMRSTLKLPAPVRAGNTLFDYVGAIDGKNAFRHLSPGTGHYLTQGKYSKQLVMWEEVNDYLDIHNSPGLPIARVDGVFDKPSDVALFNCSSGNGGCDYWNEVYPVSGDIKQAIVQSILAVDFGQQVVPTNKEIEVTPQLQIHEPDGR